MDELGKWESLFLLVVILVSRVGKWVLIFKILFAAMQADMEDGDE